jgi:leader peptidase (prepilin peptidase)/N-methyltransferase
VFDLPRELELVWWTVMGLFVGSFLNVAIHRLPRGDDGFETAPLDLPHCKKQLTWRENVPLVSWLAQRGRCPRLRLAHPVPLSAGRGPDRGSVAPVRLADARRRLAAAARAPARRQRVDRGDLRRLRLLRDPRRGLDRGHGGWPPILAVLVPRIHRTPGWRSSTRTVRDVTRTGALIAALLGLVVGGGVLLVIGWVGERVLGREAMGLGDVKLLAAAGGFIGPGGALAALVIASFVGAFAGVGNIARFQCILRERVRRRRSSKSFARTLAAARGRWIDAALRSVLGPWNVPRAFVLGEPQPLVPVARSRGSLRARRNAERRTTGGWKRSALRRSRHRPAHSSIQSDAMNSNRTHFLFAALALRAALRELRFHAVQGRARRARDRQSRVARRTLALSRARTAT